MAKPFDLRLRGVHARVAHRMVRAGIADSPDDAVRAALLHSGGAAGLIGERELIDALRAEANAEPLSDRALREGIHGLKRARGPDAPALVRAVERPQSAEARMWDRVVARELDVRVAEASLLEVERFLRAHRGPSFAWLYCGQIRRLARLVPDGGGEERAAATGAAPRAGALYTQNDFVRCFAIALVVGTALVLINVRPASAAEGPDLGRVALNYLVPFLVASLSAMLANRQRLRAAGR